MGRVMEGFPLLREVSRTSVLHCELINTMTCGADGLEGEYKGRDAHDGEETQEVVSRH